MEQLVEGKSIETKSNLVQELKAIDRWDSDYWQKPRREPYERAAYLSRQRRRTEIMRALKEAQAVL
jgi:hypothetical protein